MQSVVEESNDRSVFNNDTRITSVKMSTATTNVGERQWNDGAAPQNSNRQKKNETGRESFFDGRIDPKLFFVFALTPFSMLAKFPRELSGTLPLRVLLLSRFIVLLFGRSTLTLLFNCLPCFMDACQGC